MSRPQVLVACVKNAGRSVAAKLLLEHYGAGLVDVRSAGSAPGDAVHAEVAAVLEERGLDTGREVPTLLTPEVVQVSDVVVTMGCGETCPVFPGTRYLDWQVEDPNGQPLEQVRRIVDDLDARVRDLLAELVPGAELPGPPTS